MLCGTLQQKVDHPNESHEHEFRIHPEQDWKGVAYVRKEIPWLPQ